jgi:CheY-like chemotaxis protein
MNESGVLSKAVCDVEPLRILFVDDNIEVAKVMSTAAIQLGHDAAWASTE